MRRWRRCGAADVGGADQVLAAIASMTSLAWIDPLREA
jgi:hypothetical protein